MTLANNCWQCLEQNKIKQVCQKNVVRFFKWRIGEFGKYQRGILGPSSPNSV